MKMRYLWLRSLPQHHKWPFYMKRKCTQLNSSAKMTSKGERTFSEYSIQLNGHRLTRPSLSNTHHRMKSTTTALDPENEIDENVNSENGNKHEIKSAKRKNKMACFVQLISSDFLAPFPIPNNHKCTTTTLTDLPGSNIFPTKIKRIRWEKTVLIDFNSIYCSLHHHIETSIADTVFVWPQRNSCLLFSIFRMEILLPSGKIKWFWSNFNPFGFVPRIMFKITQAT